MKKIVAFWMTLGLIMMVVGCATTGLYEKHHHYDDLGDEYRMFIATVRKRDGGNRDNLAKLSISYFEYIDQTSMFVLRFERTITYAEIDRYRNLPSYKNNTRNDFFLSGKVGVRTRWSSHPDFVLEASSGVNRYSTASSSITEMFLITVDEEILSKIFSSSEDIVLFDLDAKARVSSIVIQGSKYKRAKARVMQFYEKYK